MVKMRRTVAWTEWGSGLRYVGVKNNKENKKKKDAFNRVSCIFFCWHGCKYNAGKCVHRKLSSHQQTHQTRQKKNTNKETTIERWECAIVVVDVLLICPGAQVAWSSNRSNKTTTLKREGNDEEQQHGWAWRVVVGLPSIVSSPCRDPFSWIVRSLSFTFSLSPLGSLF